MGRRAKFAMEWEQAMRLLLEDMQAGRKTGPPPFKFDPDFWRQATGLPWEFTIKDGRLWDPDLGKRVELTEELRFFGKGAPQVMRALQFLRAQRPEPEMWVKISLDWLAARAGVSRKIALKHIKRFRRCNLIHPLRQGRGGESSVYLVYPLTEGKVREAKIEWYGMTRQERRSLRSAVLMQEEFQ